MVANNNEDKKTEKVVRNILQFLENKTDDYQNRVALGIKTEHGWNEFTFRGIGKLSRKIACYLIKNLEVHKGERLAILSESRPEFGAAVFATIMSGMTIVPLDIKLTKYELQSILSDCKPTVMIVSNAHMKIAQELQKEVDSIKHIISLDETELSETPIPSIYNIPDNYEEKWRHRSSKSTALIIYTSGTTGAPKGVEITYSNMFAQIDAMSGLYPVLFGRKKAIKILSILPMNHLFELTVGFSLFLSFGLSIYYSKSLKPKDISTVMKEKNVNFMIVVPAFLKLLKSGIEAQLRNANKFTQIMFKVMYALAKYVPCYKIKRLMFAKIHKGFGGQFFGCISGGAPLDIPVGEFFERIGIRVYQGYGLSETSPVVCVNVDKRKDLASVGRPFKSYEAKIDSSSGELLLRGPSVMKGYYNNPEMTAEVLDEDGWLHTGDIADIDKDGHVHITGRIKNMIVLSGGKKVFPEEVEAVLRESDNFQEICVFGSSRTAGAKEGTEEIVAVIVPTEEMYNRFPDNAELFGMIKDEVKKLSNKLAPYKRPVNIVIQRDPLPKTTTRKIKRREVKELVNV